MSIEQEIRENDEANVQADMRDARIDEATDQAMKVITAVELMNALTEVDTDAVDAGTFKLNSVEDHFHTLLLCLRTEAEMHSALHLENAGLFLSRVAWMNLREYEVEPFIDD